MDETNICEIINLSCADKLFIGGQWQQPHCDKKLEIVCPVTENTIGHVPEADTKDVDQAVAAARTAFDHGEWPTLAPKVRADYVKQLAEELRKRQDDLARAWTAQMGAPYNYTSPMTSAVIGFYDYYAGLAEQFPWTEEKTTSHADSYGLLVREPVGVVAAIVPWNGPLFVMTTKVAPALIAGCTVIVKPSPETPLESYIFAECVEAAGFPPGVVNVVPAERQVSEYLVSQPGVDKVSFTGSTSAGKRIGSVCADRVSRATLELGGKSAALILDDYDLESAVKILAPTSCRNSGQVCSNLTRYLISEQRHDDFVALLAEEMKKIKVGDPLSDDTFMGPLATKRQLEKVKHYVNIAKDEGAELVLGGNQPAGIERGYFFEPTLFANVDNKSKIAQEEVFGPVVAVIPYKDLDDAIQKANDSNYGLNGAVFTNDVNLAYEVARKIRTGTVAQNGSKADFTIAFGGFKESGIGREGGVEAINHYVELKTIVLNGRPQTILQERN